MSVRRLLNTEEIKCPVKEENKALFDYYFLMYLYRQKEDIAVIFEINFFVQRRNPPLK